MNCYQMGKVGMDRSEEQTVKHREVYSISWDKP